MRNFLALIFKKLSYFLKRNLFLYFRKWNPALFIPSLKIKKNTPRNFLIFQENRNFKNISGSNFAISKNQNNHFEKTSFISGNGKHFLYPCITAQFVS